MRTRCLYVFIEIMFRLFVYCFEAERYVDIDIFMLNVNFNCKSKILYN